MDIKRFVDGIRKRLPGGELFRCLRSFELVRKNGEYEFYKTLRRGWFRRFFLLPGGFYAATVENVKEPLMLYHFTYPENAESILKNGISRYGLAYLTNEEDFNKNYKTDCKCVITVDTEKMLKTGKSIYTTISPRVFLTQIVPPDCILSVTVTEE